MGRELRDEVSSGDTLLNYHVMVGLPCGCYYKNRSPLADMDRGDDVYMDRELLEVLLLVINFNL